MQQVGCWCILQWEWYVSVVLPDFHLEARAVVDALFYVRTREADALEWKTNQWQHCAFVGDAELA